MITLVLGLIGSVFAYKILYQDREDMAFQIQVLAPGVQAGEPLLSNVSLVSVRLSKSINVAG